MRTIKCSSNCFGSKDCKNTRACSCRCDGMRKYSGALADECIRSCQSNSSFDNVPEGVGYMCRHPRDILSEIFQVPNVAMQLCGYDSVPVVDPGTAPLPGTNPPPVSPGTSGTSDGGINLTKVVAAILGLGLIIWGVVSILNNKKE